MKLIAHRFFGGDYLENSWEAINATLRIRPWAIETDVQMTADGIPVLMHDDTLDRTSNLKGLVSGYTSNELYRHGRLNNGDEIPLIEDFLAKQDGCGITSYLELKTASSFAAIAPMLSKLSDSNIIVSSFHHGVLLEAKKWNAKQRTMALFACNPVDPISIVSSCLAQEAGLGIAETTPELVAALTVQGIDCYAWTVNGQEKLDAAKKLGLNGVFTDYQTAIIRP